MKKYIEHDVKVKYHDGLFDHSKNWQWFIDEIENNYDFEECEINNWNDYSKTYRDISDLYECLIKIHGLGNIKLKFTKEWLKKLNFISLIYNKKKSIKEVWSKLNDNFFKMFALNVFITTLLNNVNEQKYYYSAYIFTQHNIFDVFDLSEVVLVESEILIYLEDIKIKDIVKLKRTFLNNLHQNTIPYNKSLFNKNSRLALSSNAFGFRHLKIDRQISWQEQYFYDMLSVEIENKKLIHLYNFNGRCYPDFSQWDQSKLQNIKSYFNNSSANFIIETIEYILHSKVPSEETIGKHFDFEIKHLNKLKKSSTFYEINDSSLRIISYLIKDNLLPKSIKQNYMKDFSLNIQKFTKPETILKLKEHSLPISAIQSKKLRNFNSNQASLADKIQNLNDFQRYCMNQYVAKGIKDIHIKQLHKIFLDIINNTNNWTISIAFYSYMILLLRAKQSPNIKNINLEYIMISLKEMWANTYYDKSVDSLQEYEFRQTIKNEEIKKHNNLFITSPMAIVINCFPTKEDSLIDMMSTISENVFSIHASQYSISQNYPFLVSHENFAEDHEIGKCFLNTIENIIINKGYKFLNVFDKHIYAKEIFDQYHHYTIFNIGLFDDWKELYNDIKESLPEFNLLDVSDNNILLGHITQLFPILEIKIRKLGSFFGIAPFKESEEEFLQAKDPSSILIKLVLQYYEGTSEFVGVSDLFFTYYSLYNSNSFNIRNECIHGNDYLSDNNLLYAFKITLFCLKLILNRIHRIEEQIQTSKDV